MKLRLLIIFLTLLYSFNCFSSHITVSQQKVFSELDKLSKDLESDDIWALYIRKFGHEKIMIRFPKSPKLKSLAANKESYCIQCKDETGEYQLFVRPLDNSKANVIQEELQKIEHGINLEKIGHFTKKQSKNILDVSYDEDKTNIHVSQRTIVTKENIFTLVSKHLKSSNSPDEYFIHSFNIFNS